MQQQPKYNILSIQGRTVVSMVPDGPMRTAALVDLESLKRLAQYIPTQDLYTIKHGITKDLDKSDNLTDILKVLADEIAFRDTISNILVLNIEDAEELLLFENTLNEGI